MLIAATLFKISVDQNRIVSVLLDVQTLTITVGDLLLGALLLCIVGHGGLQNLGIKKPPRRIVGCEAAMKKLFQARH